VFEPCRGPVASRSSHLVRAFTQRCRESPTAFCTTTYGLTSHAAWYLHPNEILDGALTGPVSHGVRRCSWTVANNPLFLDLYRRHARTELLGGSHSHGVDDTDREAAHG